MQANCGLVPIKGSTGWIRRNQELKILLTKTDCSGAVLPWDAGLLTTNGEMYFGGIDGFNYFSPNALHYNRNIPSSCLYWFEGR